VLGRYLEGQSGYRGEGKGREELNRRKVVHVLAWTFGGFPLPPLLMRGLSNINFIREWATNGENFVCKQHSTEIWDLI
jgi:hypothetical protein